MSLLGFQKYSQHRRLIKAPRMVNFGLQGESHFLNWILFIYFKYMVFCMCVCLAQYLVPTEARRECWIPWNRSYRQLLATVWVMEIKAGFSGRAPHALNHWIHPLFCHISIPMKDNNLLLITNKLIWYW